MQIQITTNKKKYEMEKALEQNSSAQIGAGMVTYERKKDKDTITIDRGVWWGRTSTKWELKIDDNSITATRRKTFEQYFVAVILMLIGGFYFVGYTRRCSVRRSSFPI